MQSGGFNGGSFGYSMGPLTTGPDPSNVSNNGKQVIFRQTSTNTFELWFWDHSVTSQCLLGVGGILNVQNITYDGATTSNTIQGTTFIVPIWTFWNSNNLPYDTINGNLFGYYSKNYIDAHFYQNIDLDQKFANYYTQSEMTTILNRYQPIYGMSSYFIKIAIVNNYYDKATVDNYIDAKIDASYVLEMMYNELGHQYFIAVDPTTSTTDAQFIINNDQKNTTHKI